MQAELWSISRGQGALLRQEIPRKHQVKKQCQCMFQLNFNSFRAMTSFGSVFFLFALSSLCFSIKNGDSGQPKQAEQILSRQLPQEYLEYIPYLLAFFASNYLVLLCHILLVDQVQVDLQVGLSDPLKFIDPKLYTINYWLGKLSLVVGFITALQIDTISIINMDLKHTVQVTQSKTWVFDIGHDINAFVGFIIVVGVLQTAKLVTWGAHLNATVKYPVIVRWSQSE